VRIAPSSSLGHTHLFVIFWYTFKCKFL
jgi:hypothetical protein